MNLLKSLSPSSIETQTVVFRQWTVQIDRKAFRRSVSIVLKPEKPILVKAGLRTPLSKIVQFLEERERWITKHLDRFEVSRQKNPPKTLEHESRFPFLGVDLKLKYVPTPLKQIFFSRNQEHLQMHIPLQLWGDFEEPDLQTHLPALQKFYHQEAEKLIRERLLLWATQINLYPRQVRFRNQKSRWGSCSSNGALNLNWRLIGAPLEVIDYVLIHELCHLKHLNHSEQFWQLVHLHCSHVVSSEKWLKEQGASLDFLN